MNKTGGVTVTGFEGPEKRLEVDFKKNFNRPDGLRAINKDQWQEMLNFSACTIISQTSNEYFDAYVLSESSLFVYPYKIMIKTCGTTTLLKIIPKLMEYALTCELDVELVMYSRKNFLFPELQQFPHTDWRVELEYLDNHFVGKSYILGPLTEDHWYLYLADYSENGANSKEQTIEIMMHNLNRNTALNFYRKEGTSDRDKFPGVADLIEGQETDEFNFNPCGYSMNGLCGDVYSTIHVTPEPQCSYASFETNLSLPSYKGLIENVFALFRPGTVTLTLFSEKENESSHPIQRMSDLEVPGYKLTFTNVSEFGRNRDLILCTYESYEFIAAKKSQRVRSASMPMQPLVDIVTV